MAHATCELMSPLWGAHGRCGYAQGRLRVSNGPVADLGEELASEVCVRWDVVFFRDVIQGYSCVEGYGV